MKHRVWFVFLGLAFAAVIAATVLLAPQGRRQPLPDVIERIEPAPDAIVLRQTSLEIDLASGYRLELFIDGRTIPPEEIESTAGLSLFTWRPGPGRTFEEWSPGLHTVLIRWDTTSGLPDPGDAGWTFRVQ